MRYAHVILAVVGLLGACSDTDTSSPLGIWHSKYASIEERTRAASILVTNGTPRTEAVRLLGEPNGEVHANGFATRSAAIVAVGDNGAPAATPPIWYDQEHLLYRGSDGMVICLRFDIVGYESNMEKRPLLGICIMRTNLVYALRPATEGR
jgi:hypothetical protein